MKNKLSTCKKTKKLFCASCFCHLSFLFGTKIINFVEDDLMNIPIWFQLAFVDAKWWQYLTWYFILSEFYLLKRLAGSFITYLYSSCTGSIWAVKLHWLHKFLYGHWPRYSFLVPDLCWAKSISTDFTEDTIKNDKNDACYCS